MTYKVTLICKNDIVHTVHLADKDRLVQFRLQLGHAFTTNTAFDIEGKGAEWGRVHPADILDIKEEAVETPKAVFWG